jgi:hypothetical protein
MNCRRGLKRVYVILTVVWITFVLAATLPEYWQPWRSTLPDWVRADEFLLTKNFSNAKPLDVDAFMAGQVRKEIKREKWIWMASLCAMVPLILYAFLFYVVPWAYRGFRPETQI